MTAAAFEAERHCASCGRRMQPRRSWRDGGDAVRYCSRACRARRLRPVDRQLETTILDLLGRRATGATICPSEAARAAAGEEGWRPLMEPARRAARRLHHAGAIEIVQKGRVVDPSEFRGPIRLRRRPR